MQPLLPEVALEYLEDAKELQKDYMTIELAPHHMQIIS